MSDFNMAKPSAEHHAAADTQRRRAERLIALGTMAAGLAHGLRNPLNAAHLQLEVAQRKLVQHRGADVDTALGAVTLAQAELTRLAELVTDFLQFARPRTLQLAACELRALAQTAIDALRAEAQRCGVAVQLDAGPRLAIEADGSRLDEALQHLVRNAIEASPRGSTVHVRVESQGLAARMAVIDAGTGVQHGAAVFEPFFTTKVQGTGLGLAIVHRCALDHAGAVTFGSAPGRTEFSMTLPLRHTL